MKRLVQMDPPAPRMTVADYAQWERRQILAFPAWLPISVTPGDVIDVTMTGDGSTYRILIVDDEGGTSNLRESLRVGLDAQSSGGTSAV